MRFNQYLIEDRRIEQARKKLAKRVNVDPKYLDYIGDDEYGYYFNITDKNIKNIRAQNL